jgi:hypothetical protein
MQWVSANKGRLFSYLLSCFGGFLSRLYFTSFGTISTVQLLTPFTVGPDLPVFRGVIRSNPELYINILGSTKMHSIQIVMKGVKNAVADSG